MQSGLKIVLYCAYTLGRNLHSYLDAMWDFE